MNEELMTQTDNDIHAFFMPEDAPSERLDKFLSRNLEDFSRARVQSLIKDGQVRQVKRSENDAACSDAYTRIILERNHKVKPGECYEISVPPAAPAAPGPEDIPLDVVYEDGDLIVINKPAGLVVHPGAGNWTGTLVNALLAHCGDSLSGIGGVRRPGIVHRLDKDTTGLMVVAKNDAAHQGLARQFADHGRTGGLERRYMALVWARPRTPKGRIDTLLARKHSNRQKMTVVRKDGRNAITLFEVGRSFGDPAAPLISQVMCRLYTGRTHQIRVHMAHIGHPVVGDQTYGTSHMSKIRLLPEDLQELFKAFPRQALHAATLGFEHPATGQALSFSQPLPEDIQTLVIRLQALEI